MKIIVIAEVEMQKEFESKGIPEGIELHFETKYSESINADVFFYLLDESTIANQTWLGKVPAPVFVNAVYTTLADLPKNAVRINGWNSFIKRPVAEVVFGQDNAEVAKQILTTLNLNYQEVPDAPGMIAPKVIAMIINEAYFALEDKVSTKEEIDTAMKLGTNYPYGPFEWSGIIGLKNIYSLLKKLSESDSRYMPASLLIKELQ